MDIRGILVFLLIAFGVGIPAQLGLLSIRLMVWDEPTFLHTIVKAALMFVPAAAAWIAAQVSPRPTEHAGYTVWPVPMPWLVRVVIAVTLVFAVANGINFAAGWTTFDPGVGEAINRLPIKVEDSVKDMTPAVMILGLFALSVVLGPFLYGAVALGSEWGWRQFLLPRLLPLGKFPAYILSGLLWALWCTPMIVSYYRYLMKPQDMWVFLGTFSLFCIVLGAVLGEVVLRTRNVGLAAALLGTLYASGEQGPWRYLFPMDTPPWTGTAGVTIIVCLLPLALFPRLLLGLPAAPLPAADEKPPVVAS
jgi:hypothetical protein